MWYLLALVADVISISVHGKACGVIVEACSWSGYRLTLVQTFIFEPHQSLSPHILIQLFNGVEQVLDHRVIDFVLQTIRTNRSAMFVKVFLLTVITRNCMTVKQN